MNKTPNYQLNQWEATDKVQRVDFNADNAKIDAALAALMAEKGNCRIITGSYTGTGTYGVDHVNTLVLPREPIFVCVCGMYSMLAMYGCDRAFATGGPGSWLVDTTWSGRKLSWYGVDVYQQLNEKSRVYPYFALFG